MDTPAPIERDVLESEPAVQKEEKEWPLTPSLTVIQPHETEEVSLEWIVNNQKQKLPKRRVQMKSCSYNVEVRYADFEGRSMSLKFECQCPE